MLHRQALQGRMHIEIDLTRLTEAASQFDQLAKRASNIAPAGTAIAQNAFHMPK